MIGHRLLLVLLLLVIGTKAKGQFTDDFTDGDFTTGTVWSGEVDSFQVNGALQLQSKGDPTSGDIIYLVTPSTIMDSVEWNFYTELDFNPSSTNYVRIYLASDQANLEGPLNGYFLQIGEAGATNDSIDLFRQNGTTLTKLLTSTMGCTGSSTNNGMRIRVTRDQNGKWDLYADCSGGTSYTFQGTVTDPSISTTAFFGVYCRYSTASRNDLYFFDDFNVNTIVGDTTRPTVASVSVISQTQLDVQFSEPVALASSQNTANYSVTPGIGLPSAANRDGVDFSLVHLTFSPGFTNGSSYQLGVTNVQDTSGNLNIPVNEPFTYFVPVAAGPRDVIINEIFADPTPAVGLPEDEFVELYNASTNTFDLNGWTFTDGSSTVTLGAYVLNPGDYVILCANADTALFSPFGPVLGLTSLPTLNNSADNLGLRENGGALIDSVEYRLSWYQDPVKDDGGWSLELINPVDSCAIGANNWIASIDPDGGTPGQQNSVYSIAPDVLAPILSSTTLPAGDTIRVCFSEPVTLATASNPSNYSLTGGTQTISTVVPIGPPYTCVDIVLSAPMNVGTIYYLTIQNLEDCSGNSQIMRDTLIQGAGALPYEVLINEIFPDPSPIVGLPESEFVELFNNSNKFIDLEDWTFSDASSTATLPAYTIAPGEHLILTASANEADYLPYGNVLTVGSLPSLNNTSDSLDLRDDAGILIHEVNYNIAWYQDDTKDDGGWTLELINPDDTCDRLGNWIASNDPDGGTPGRQNSVYNNTPDITPPNIVSTVVTSGNSIEICFDETMDLAILTNPNNYSADNGLGNPATAVVQGAGIACVELTFATNIDTGIVYTLTLTGLQDCKGNSLGILQTTFVLGGPGGPGDIVINEFIPDTEPSIGLPIADFVEIYNRSTKVINVRDWTLTDRSASVATLPDFNMFPGDYLIITAAANVDTFQTFGNVVGVSSFPSLNNDGDSLELYNRQGQLVDLAYYDESWYADEDKEDDGWSIERVDPDFTCLNGGNWRASVDPIGGTPGTLNSVDGTFSDSESPELDYVVVIDPTLIRVYFTELMDEGSLSDPNNFVIDNGIGNPIATVPAVAGFAVDMLLPVALDTNTQYCITVSNVQDCPGNPLTTATACFGIPIAPVVGDIIINEILFDPVTGGSRYVELYNLSNNIIDLRDLYIGQIAEGTDSIINADHVMETQRLILPQSYICITKDRLSQIEVYQPINPSAIVEIDDMPSYGNDDECVIALADNTILDRLKYENEWHFANLDSDDGVSLERLSFTAPTQDQNNWHSAASNVNYGTPGYKNSQQITINPNSGQVWLEPETFSPDQDGFDDFLTINYQFDQPGANARVSVLDNRGRMVAIVAQNTLLSTDAGFFRWDGTTAAGRKADIGIYVILFEVSFPATGETEYFKLPAVVAGRIGN